LAILARAAQENEQKGWSDGFIKPNRAGF